MSPTCQKQLQERFTNPSETVQQLIDIIKAPGVIYTIDAREQTINKLAELFEKCKELK